MEILPLKNYLQLTTEKNPFWVILEMGKKARTSLVILRVFDFCEPAHSAFNFLKSRHAATLKAM